MLTATQLSALAWEKMNGLLPCTVQDALTGKVLMLGYMNKAAAEHSVSSGLVTFDSRNKTRPWTKSENPGRPVIGSRDSKWSHLPFRHRVVLANRERPGKLRTRLLAAHYFTACSRARSSKLHGQITRRRCTPLCAKSRRRRG